MNATYGPVMSTGENTWETTLLNTFQSEINFLSPTETLYFKIRAKDSFIELRITNELCCHVDNVYL